MKLARPQEQKRTFRICSNRAQQASLVIDMFPGVPQIFPLRRVSEGVWETELRLTPGEYRFCYHLYDGRSLQYMTPAGLETDGLKAVLRIPSPPPRENELAAVRSRRLEAKLAWSEADDDHDSGSAMLRRVAG